MPGKGRDPEGAGWSGILLHPTHSRQAERTPAVPGGQGKGTHTSYVTFSTTCDPQRTLPSEGFYK